MLGRPGAGLIAPATAIHPVLLGLAGLKRDSLHPLARQPTSDTGKLEHALFDLDSPLGETAQHILWDTVDLKQPPARRSP